MSLDKWFVKAKAKYEAWAQARLDAKVTNYANQIEEVLNPTGNTAYTTAQLARMRRLLASAGFCEDDDTPRGQHSRQS